MPELPEVETVRRDLIAARLPGRTIADLSASWPRSVYEREPALRAALIGSRFALPRRRGKYLLFPFDGGPAMARTLVVHLRMSGRLWLVAPEADDSGYTRVRIALDDGRELRLHDPRKFARVSLVADAERDLPPLGVEPLDPSFTPETFRSAIEGRRGALKPLLLGQRVVAGLGNIYVDEALWEARLHPLRRVDALSPAEAARLAEAIVTVLKRGVANLGTSLGSGKTNFALPGLGRLPRNQEELRVFRRTGAPCPRCATPIERTVVGQRSTHLCPTCQRITPDT